MRYPCVTGFEQRKDRQAAFWAAGEVSKMRITITEIMTANGETEVRFLCGFGGARGTWRGGQPEIGRSYEVEINLDDDLRWGTDIVEIPENEINTVSTLGEKVAIAGVLEEKDLDTQYYLLRIGPCILPFLAQGTPLSEGTPVRVYSDRCELFPWLVY